MAYASFLEREREIREEAFGLSGSGQEQDRKKVCFYLHRQRQTVCIGTLTCNLLYILITF